MSTPTRIVPPAERIKGQCIYNVWHQRGVGGYFYQCQNKPIKDGFCGVHHPDAIKARDERRESEYQRKRKADALRWLQQDIGYIVMREVGEPKNYDDNNNANAAKMLAKYVRRKSK